VVCEPGRLQFLTANPGERFNGQDPTVSIEALHANRSTLPEVVYIGSS
jgi:hypothetical protein